MLLLFYSTCIIRCTVTLTELLRWVFVHLFPAVVSPYVIMYKNFDDNKVTYEASAKPVACSLTSFSTYSGDRAANFHIDHTSRFACYDTPDASRHAQQREALTHNP
eukprot:2938853-Pyramimonas_sp.AAC.1